VNDLAQSCFRTGLWYERSFPMDHSRSDGREGRVSTTAADRAAGSSATKSPASPQSIQRFSSGMSLKCLKLSLTSAQT
jgi:hypothetical protein